MDSILTLARTEGMLFKFGSGTGGNLSAIRSSQEIARRRHGIGPGVVHEGLRRVCRRDQVCRQTRRAAKMVILNADIPT